MILALNSLLFDSTLKIDIIVDVTGESITTANGNVTVSSSIIVDVVGSYITSAGGDVDASEKYKIVNFIKIEKSKNVFAIQEKELDFIVQNAQILNLMPKEIKFILENTWKK